MVPAPVFTKFKLPDNVPPNPPAEVAPVRVKVAGAPPAELVMVPPVPASELLLFKPATSWLLPFRSSAPLLTCTVRPLPTPSTYSVLAPAFNLAVPPLTKKVPVNSCGWLKVKVPASDLVTPPLLMMTLFTFKSPIV